MEFNVRMGKEWAVITRVVNMLLFLFYVVSGEGYLQNDVRQDGEWQGLSKFSQWFLRQVYG